MELERLRLAMRSSRSIALAAMLVAGAAEAREETTVIPRAVAVELLGCWEIPGGSTHRIVFERRGRGVSAHHRWDTWSGSRRALRTELHRGIRDGALFFAGFSSNHHAGLLVVRRVGPALEVRPFYRIGPDRPWSGGMIASLARRCVAPEGAP